MSFMFDFVILYTIMLLQGVDADDDLDLCCHATYSSADVMAQSPNVTLVCTSRVEEWLECGLSQPGAVFNSFNKSSLVVQVYAHEHTALVYHSDNNDLPTFNASMCNVSVPLADSVFNIDGAAQITITYQGDAGIMSVDRLVPLIQNPTIDRHCFNRQNYLYLRSNDRLVMNCKCYISHGLPEADDGSKLTWLKDGVPAEHQTLSHNGHKALANIEMIIDPGRRHHYQCIYNNSITNQTSLPLNATVADLSIPYDLEPKIRLVKSTCPEEIVPGAIVECVCETFVKGSPPSHPIWFTLEILKNPYRRLFVRHKDVNSPYNDASRAVLTVLGTHMYGDATLEQRHECRSVLYRTGDSTFAPGRKKSYTISFEQDDVYRKSQARKRVCIGISIFAFLVLFFASYWVMKDPPQTKNVKPEEMKTTLFLLHKAVVKGLDETINDLYKQSVRRNNNIHNYENKDADPSQVQHRDEVRFVNDVNVPSNASLGLGLKSQFRNNRDKRNSVPNIKTAKKTKQLQRLKQKQQKQQKERKQKQEKQKLQKEKQRLRVHSVIRKEKNVARLMKSLEDVVPETETPVKSWWQHTR